MDERKIDKIATQLDDISLTLEEIQEEPCLSDAKHKLNRVQQTLERTADAMDEIENAMARREENE
jgi:methyl-accepting chemotaxis protein